MDFREQKIVEYLQIKGALSSKEIFDRMSPDYSYATLKRILSDLVSENYLVSVGKGRGTKHKISPVYEIIQPIDMEKYYEKEMNTEEIELPLNK